MKKGMVREYNSHGDLKFEGEYINGKRNDKKNIIRIKN